MAEDQEKLSQRYRAWIVTLAQEERLDGIATNRLAAPSERRAPELHRAHLRLREPIWEDRMMAARLLDPIQEEAISEFRHSVRAAFASDVP